jgi:hypothetical protein
MKPVGVSIQFCPLDVAAPSRGLTTGLTMSHVGERADRVVAFDNLGDDSLLDARGTPFP